MPKRFRFIIGLIIFGLLVYFSIFAFEIDVFFSKKPNKLQGREEEEAAANDQAIANKNNLDFYYDNIFEESEFKFAEPAGASEQSSDAIPDRHKPKGHQESAVLLGPAGRPMIGFDPSLKGNFATVLTGYPRHPLNHYSVLGQRNAGKPPLIGIHSIPNGEMNYYNNSQEFYFWFVLFLPFVPSAPFASIKQHRKK